MILLSTKPKSNRRITAKELNGVMYILDPHKGQLHTLNETAKLIWTQIQKRNTVSQIIDIIMHEFSVPYNIARKDVIDFLKRMEKFHVIDSNSGNRKSGKNLNKKSFSAK